MMGLRWVCESADPQRELLCLTGAQNVQERWTRGPKMKPTTSTSPSLPELSLSIWCSDRMVVFARCFANPSIRAKIAASSNQPIGNCRSGHTTPPSGAPRRRALCCKHRSTVRYGARCATTAPGRARHIGKLAQPPIAAGRTLEKRTLAGFVERPGADDDLELRSWIN